MLFRELYVTVSVFLIHYSEPGVLTLPRLLCQHDCLMHNRFFCHEKVALSRFLSHTVLSGAAFFGYEIE